MTTSYFFAFINTSVLLLNALAWSSYGIDCINWITAVLSSSNVSQLFSYTLAIATSQEKKCTGVRSGNLGGQMPLEMALSKNSMQQLHGFIGCVRCSTILFKVGVVNFILTHLCNEQKQTVVTVAYRVDSLMEETQADNLPLGNGNTHTNLLVVQRCLVKCIQVFCRPEALFL